MYRHELVIYCPLHMGAYIGHSEIWVKGRRVKAYLEAYKYSRVDQQ